MAEIVEKVGNIFTTSCDVVAVTVNTVGDMGAGIALEARYRYPDAAEHYSQLCSSGTFDIGQLLLWQYSSPKLLLFPTKRHWRHPSRMAYVTAGLDKLATTYRARDISTIALPHLGASHGGLEWPDVREQVVQRLEPLEDLYVELWEFDPEDADPLFVTLRRRLGGLEPPQVQTTVGLRAQEARLLVDVLEHSETASMAVLQRTRGLGQKSLESIYAFAMSTEEEIPARQLGLGGL